MRSYELISLKSNNSKYCATCNVMFLRLSVLPKKSKFLKDEDLVLPKLSSISNLSPTPEKGGHYSQTNSHNLGLVIQKII